MKLVRGIAVTYGLSAILVHAAAITTISGRIGVTEFGPIAAMGPGAVCAHIESAAGKEPGSGQGCNDQTMIGPMGSQEPIINQDTTQSIGNLLKDTVGLALMGKTALEAGRGITYRVDKSDDKAALDDGELLFARVGMGNFVASARQTIHKENGRVTVDGTANAVAQGRGQFAAAIVNDPLYFNADTSTVDPLITLAIGSDLSVQADPGDMASVIVQVGQNGLDILDFAITVNDGVSSASQALQPISCDSSALGKSCASYLNTNVLPFLTWNSGTRTVSATGNIPVFRMVAPSDGSSVEATLNYAGVVGTQAPEPGTWLLAAMGMGVLLGNRAKTRLVSTAWPRNQRPDEPGRGRHKCPRHVSDST
jgi:hypothetical protein